MNSEESKGAVEAAPPEGAAPVAKPQDADSARLLEHEYDGIREYDNPLPGWWVYLFWLTILASPVYYVYYDLGLGLTVEEEYAVNASNAAALEAELLAQQDLSESGLAALMENSGAMKGMSQEFTTHCSTCHGPNAQGLTGPNLTDEYWLHGGSLIEIYETIRDGVPGKEMQSWLPKLGPGKVMMMAAYLGTKRNTNLPGVKPQGQKYNPAKPTPENDGDPKEPVPDGSSPETGQGR